MKRFFNNTFRALISKIRLSVLLIIVFFGYNIGLIFAQTINVYNTFQQTINIRISKPLAPVEPINYAKIGSDFSNDMNQIAAQREAQKQQLYNITQEAIRDVNSYSTLGYSTTINNIVSNLQSSMLEEIQTDYQLLTSGQRDPNGYSNILTSKVNVYINFLKSFDVINTKLKSTFDQLLGSNHLAFANNLATLINQYSLKVVAEFEYDGTKVSKRYSNEPYNQRITLSEEYERGRFNKINVSDFNAKINNYCNKITSIQETEMNSLEGELKVDLAFRKIHKTQFGSFLLPETLIDSKRAYNDGTILNLATTISSTDVGLNKRFTNREEMSAFLKDLKVKFDPNIPWLGFSVDYDFRVISVTVGSTGQSSGVKLGDKILAIDGVKITGLNQFNLAGKSAGQKITISILRNQKKIIISGVLKGHPEVVNSYFVNISGQEGIVIAKTIAKEEYSVTSKFLMVSVAFPRNSTISDLSVITYEILMPTSKSNITPIQYLTLFTPFIRAINESIILK